MTSRITSLETHDVRFPTSRHLDGSDAMNPFPDYSAAYVVLQTSEGEVGHGFVFTDGRGNDVQVAAIEALRPLVVGRGTDEVLGGPRRVRALAHRRQPARWLGPHKGAIHMAAGAVINAAWDLYARREGKPLWLVLADLHARAARARWSTSATSGTR